ncbi:MAG TPA: alpha/beta family hydrolase [Usitatibacter sp.]|nr:alpha/beta family hydrolase [Usitatibacter sp.]
MAPAQLLQIEAGGVALEGALEIPPGARGLVVFAHGSGSGRLSPRNRFVARALQHDAIATLLLDLLTPIEDLDARSRFDTALLSERLDAAVRWARARPESSSLPVALFGASTGAAAALRVAAADRGIASVVSRGGRPDLAGVRALAHVRAPTLLVVGGLDAAVIELNREALERMKCERELQIVPGATHLFEEPGALEAVAALASRWFAAHFPPRMKAA